MREGSPAVSRSRLAWGGHAVLIVLGCLTLALAVGGWPLAGLAHQSVNSGSGGAPF